MERLEEGSRLFYNTLEVRVRRKIQPKRGKKIRKDGTDGGGKSTPKYVLSPIERRTKGSVRWTMVWTNPKPSGQGTSEFSHACSQQLIEIRKKERGENMHGEAHASGGHDFSFADTMKGIGVGEIEIGEINIVVHIPH